MKRSKRDVLIESAIVEISKKGYSGCSIKDITDSAGYAVGTFYTYFENKEKILAAIYDELSGKQFALTNMMKLLTEMDPVKRLVCTTCATIWRYGKFPELSLILFVKTLGINQEIEKLYFEIFDNAKNGIVEMLHLFSEKELVSVQDTEVAAISYLHVMNGNVIEWLRTGQNKKIEELCFEIICFNFCALNISFQKDELLCFINQLFSDGLFEQLEERIKNE